MNKRTAKQGVLLLMLPLALSLFFSVQGHAHAVHGETGSSSEALCTSASYEDGEAMSYATVEIIAPNSKLPFQSGRTDRNGYFCFRPDTPGRWKITVKDEDGHFVRLGTKVSKEMLKDE
ncbi:MAG: hypothetical protein D3917_07015 [Candidatus Electrothrix sp. AX5]|jgi:nickel transport protein|uniref:Nickel transport protein n=1 Tax=Candidatus Electrothrix aarhusensis TaxID=1859131 RepID=A0A3S4T4J7_9BACT|nr:hypothetical protein [Candidatus Electrothrix sp. AX5]RWX42882.1 nickel transport protein [Candidatus Electrothrix aarhusensis]